VEEGGVQINQDGESGCWDGLGLVWGCTVRCSVVTLDLGGRRLRG
jgi:hypothetical protein